MTDNHLKKNFNHPEMARSKYKRVLMLSTLLFLGFFIYKIMSIIRNKSTNVKLLVFENGLVYENSNLLYSKEDLIFIKQAVERTLLFYDKNNISKEKIAQNNLSFQQHQIQKVNELQKEPKGIVYDHLYVIFDSVNKSLKIGRSKTPKTRLKTLQLSTSNKLELLKVVKGQGEMEKPIHEKFASKRLASEWFEDCKEIRNYFKI